MAADARVEPWQVWWTDLDPQVGREQAGRRPAIVVGTGFACSLPNGLVLVVPCTTRDRGLPIHPEVTGLGRASFALCDQLETISRQRLVSRHRGVLDPASIAAVRFVLRRTVDVG